MARRVVRDLIESQAGQIKIDLSVTDYEIDEGLINGKRKVRKLKYPSLSKIISVLEKTGARVRRISSRVRYTIIDYTT